MAVRTFWNASKATPMPRSFWSLWNVFITSNFPFVAAEEGQHWAQHFLMYMESLADVWSLSLALIKKNGRFKLEEELEMREGTGLRRGGASPDWETGRGIGIGVVLPDHLELVAKCSLLATALALWQDGQVALWRSTRMAWTGIQCSIIKWLKLEATCSKATSWMFISSILEEMPLNWEETKTWSPHISLIWLLTNSISGVDPTSRVGWGQFNSA